MGIKCKLGFHHWNGCTCTECGRHRDTQHHWSSSDACGASFCTVCGEKRNGHSHQFELVSEEITQTASYESGNAYPTLGVRHYKCKFCEETMDENFCEFE